MMALRRAILDRDRVAFFAHGPATLEAFFSIVPTLGYWHSGDLGLLTLGQ
jgi:hypothetical protein